MFQSRWGFHPCDNQTFRKLKVLHHVYQTALRMAHAWERWNRKDPQNRVMRRRIRNDKGQTIGYDLPIALAEPRICPVFSQQVQESRHVDKKGVIHKDGFFQPKVMTDDMGIVEAFSGARRPVKEAGDVRPMRISVESIEALFELARRWLNDRNVS
jgi:hypothetical protein